MVHAASAPLFITNLIILLAAVIVNYYSAVVRGRDAVARTISALMSKYLACLFLCLGDRLPLLLSLTTPHFSRRIGSNLYFLNVPVS